MDCPEIGRSVNQNTKLSGIPAEISYALYMDESLVHTSFLLHDHTLNSMLGNIRCNGDPPCWPLKVFIYSKIFKLNME